MAVASAHAFRLSRSMRLQKTATVFCRVMIWVSRATKGWSPSPSSFRAVPVLSRTITLHSGITISTKLFVKVLPCPSTLFCLEAEARRRSISLADGRKGRMSRPAPAKPSAARLRSLTACSRPFAPMLVEFLVPTTIHPPLAYASARSGVWLNVLPTLEIVLLVLFMVIVITSGLLQRRLFCAGSIRTVRQCVSGATRYPFPPLRGERAVGACTHSGLYGR